VVSTLSSYGYVALLMPSTGRNSQFAEFPMSAGLLDIPIFALTAAAALMSSFNELL
jgi:hypothetical protein